MRDPFRERPLRALAASIAFLPVAWAITNLWFPAGELPEVRSEAAPAEAAPAPAIPLQDDASPPGSPERSHAEIRHP